MDDNQNVYGSTFQVPKGFRPFGLTVNCRNTRAIHREVVKKYRGVVEPEVSGPEGRPPELIHEEDQRGEVARVLERLCGAEEITTHDVAVLSSHGTKNSRIYNEGLPLQVPRDLPASAVRSCHRRNAERRRGGPAHRPAFQRGSARLDPAVLAPSVRQGSGIAASRRTLPGVRLLTERSGAVRGVPLRRVALGLGVPLGL
jgi:hypothetical protein